jgi:hypothetical protein
MIKANDLIKQQKEKELKKRVIYEKIYKLVEKKISLSSQSDNYYTLFLIPEFMIGQSLYSLKDCNEYIKDKLKDNGFKVEIYDPNILYVNWEPTS